MPTKHRWRFQVGDMVRFRVREPGGRGLGVVLQRNTAPNYGARPETTYRVTLFNKDGLSRTIYAVPDEDMEPYRFPPRMLQFYTDAMETMIQDSEDRTGEVNHTLRAIFHATMAGNMVCQRETVLGPLRKSGVDTWTGAGLARVPLPSSEHYGLYFSASWCPPCRAFKKAVVQWYEAWKARHSDPHGDSLTMVIVSRDTDRRPSRGNMGYDGMLKQMPGFVGHFGPTRAKQLMKSFGLTTIPSLVILDRGGNVVTTHARDEIVANPTWDFAAPSADGMRPGQGGT